MSSKSWNCIFCWVIYGLVFLSLGYFSVTQAYIDNQKYQVNAYYLVLTSIQIINIILFSFLHSKLDILVKSETEEHNKSMED